jgi:hypothetical protein
MRHDVTRVAALNSAEFAHNPCNFTTQNATTCEKYHHIIPGAFVNVVIAKVSEEAMLTLLTCKLISLWE